MSSSVLAKPFRAARPSRLHALSHAARSAAQASGVEPVVADSKATNVAAARAQGVLFSAMLAAALTAGAPALAISGGKGSSGIYKPLDDVDLSGQDLRKSGYTKGSLRRAKFDGSDLSGVSFFGALCEKCSFVGSNLSGATLESADLEGANFDDAVLEGAMVTNAQLRKVSIKNSDWTDVILRRDQQLYLCSIAEGVNPTTGVDTRESLVCPPK